MVYELIVARWSEGLESYRRQGPDWQIELRGQPWTTKEQVAATQARRLVTLLFKLLGNSVRVPSPFSGFRIESTLLARENLFAPNTDTRFLTGLRLRLSSIRKHILLRLPNAHLRLPLAHPDPHAHTLLPLRLLLRRLLPLAKRDPFH